MTGKHALIRSGANQRYVRRDKAGLFMESVEVSGSLAVDRLRTDSKPGQGQGDCREGKTS